MPRTPTVLESIRRDLNGYVGQRVRLRSDRGRKRIVVREGRLEGIYPHVFVVRLDQAPHRGRAVSYSYADLLTASVELMVMGEGGEAKFEPTATAVH